MLVATGFFKNSKREYVLMPKSLIASYLLCHLDQCPEFKFLVILEVTVPGHEYEVRFIEGINVTTHHTK